MAQIIFLKEGRHSIRFPIRTAEVCIGRRSDSEITLEGSDVSRDHAVIFYQEGYYYLKDVSKNGTDVNRQQVKQVRLQDKDLISIGEWQLQFLDSPNTGDGKTVTRTSAQISAKGGGARGIPGMAGDSKEMCLANFEKGVRAIRCK